jgi:hypothetical protein
MGELKEYVVTLKKYEDLDDFYEDMESPGGSVYIPDRRVDVVHRRPLSRNTHYWLTDQEAEQLRSDVRVEAVTLTLADLGLEITPIWTQTSTAWDKTTNNGSTHKNWGLLRCVEGAQRANWGSDSTPTDRTQTGTIQVNADGSNVDVVIVDGFLDPAHPEFALNEDGTGGTRFVAYNWLQHNPSIKGTAAGNYVYNPLDNPNDGGNNHGAHVAGIACGNTQGWARKSNIYNLNPYGTDPNAVGQLFLFDYLRAFHNNKPVNPATNRRNPTICNNSWGIGIPVAISSIFNLTYRGNAVAGPFTRTSLLQYGLVAANNTTVVINYNYPALNADIQDAINDGIIVVASAGNTGHKIDVSGGVDYDNRILSLQWLSLGQIYYHRGGSPGGATNTITVGAVDSTAQERKANYSEAGPRIDIYAPGTAIMSSLNGSAGGQFGTATDPRNSSYYIGKASGTSMAAPQVTGILALALQSFPRYNQESLKIYLNTKAKTGQLTDSGGSYSDRFSLQGSNNRYLYYFEEIQLPVVPPDPYANVIFEPTFFPSVSSCAPGSSVKTKFLSSDNQKLNIWSNITVTVNGVTANTRPITLKKQDLVQATVTASAGTLSYRFIPYTLGDKQQYFAVVNRNNYAPTVKATENYKRWYNYYVIDLKYSWHDGFNTSGPYTLGLGWDTVDVDNMHIVLDPVNRFVHFYRTDHEHVASVGMPGGPIEYRKINFTVPPVDTFTQDLLVLCNDGKLYRITYNNNFVVSDKFDPGGFNVFPFDDLPYQEDVPGGGSFTDQARENYLRALFPSVTCMDINANTIWIAGQDTVYLVNKNFTLLGTVTVGGENILGIACAEASSAIVVTRNQRVYRVRSGQSPVLLYSGAALGGPGTLPDGNRVAVPDPNNQRLLIFNTSALETTWSTVGFAPAYARTFGGQLYVSGHDNNQVLRYLADNVYEVINFKRKVTLVDVVSNGLGTSILGTHNLENFTVLDLSGVQRVIPFTVDKRYGPLNHIGTPPQQVVLLGQESITPIAGPDLTVWSDGVAGGSINTGSWVSASFKAGQDGAYRRPFIIGETAIDYDIEVLSSAVIQDYYSLSTAVLRLANPYGSILEPDVGGLDEGVTGPIPLGFTLNMYGRQFGNIYVGTNGYLYFGNDYYINRNPVFGDLTVDSLYVEPRDLYQGFPVNNVDPNNITNGRLDTGQTPGLYVKYDSLVEFTGFRLRWIGTTMASYPLGNTISTVYTTTNHNELLMPTLVGIAVGDYISGSNVTVSTQVTSKSYYTTNVEIYSASGTRFLTAEPTTVKKYSRIDNLFSFYNFANTTTISGNAVLAQSVTGTIGSVIVNGIISANVTQFHVFEFPYQLGALSTTVRQVKARSITTRSKTITPIAIWDTDPTSYIYVSAADYAKVYVNHILFGASIQTTRVTAKSYTQKTFTLTADYSKISEGFLQTIYTPPEFDANGNITVNGFWTNTVIQGATVSFTLSTQNVPGGSQFPYTVTTQFGNITSSDFVGNPPLSGTISAGDTIQFRANTDFVTEGLESFIFRISNLSVISDEILSVQINLSEDLVSTPASMTTTRVFDEYRLSIANGQTITTNSTINLTETELGFDNPKFADGTLFGNVTYRLHEHFLFEPGYNQGSATQDVYENVKFNANFTGNFVGISNALTIATATPILFKANVAHPGIAYEVGIYTGKNYQYIEYFFDNQYHTNAEVGIMGIDGIATGDYVKLNNTQSGNSVLFGSYISNGEWQYLGSGSFNNVNQGFEPRHPRIFKADQYTDANEQRYDILIDQKFPSYANVRYSLDYGFLYRNDGYDFGNRNAATNDILTVVIPFNNNRKPVSTILGIGNYQVTLPAVPDVIWPAQLENSTSIVDAGNELTLNPSITIPVAGEYMLPDVYRSATGTSATDFEYVRTRAGANLTITSRYYDFQAGDILTLRNLITSRRSYDVREVVVSGPRFLRFYTRTSSANTFLPLNYGTLDQPFVRYFDNTDTPVYRSSNIQLLSTAGSLSGKLFATGHGVSFVLNGFTANSRVLDNVSTGSLIALEWAVASYFASNSIVYHIQTDSLDSGNIFVPIGLWSINNRSVIGGALTSLPTVIDYQTAQAYLEDVDTFLTTPAVTAQYLDSLTNYITVQTEGEFLDSKGTFITQGPVESKDIVPGNYYWTAKMADSAWLSQGQRDTTGIIATSFLSNDFQLIYGNTAGQAGNGTTVMLGKMADAAWEDFFYQWSLYQHQANVDPVSTILPGAKITGNYFPSKVVSFLGKIAEDTRPIQTVTYTGRIGEGLDLPPSFATYMYSAETEKIYTIWTYRYTDTRLPGKSDGFEYTNDPELQSPHSILDRLIEQEYLKPVTTTANLDAYGLTPISIGTKQIDSHYLVAGPEGRYRYDEQTDKLPSLWTAPVNYEPAAYSFYTSIMTSEKAVYNLQNVDLTTLFTVSTDRYLDFDPEFYYANIIVDNIDHLFYQDKLYEYDFDTRFVQQNILDFEQRVTPNLIKEAAVDIDFVADFYQLTTILPDFDSLFISPTDIYVDTEFSMVKPPEFYVDIDPLFIRPPDYYFAMSLSRVISPGELINFGHQWIQAPDLLIDFDPLFVKPTDLYFNFSPLRITPPDFYVDIDPVLVSPTAPLLPFNPFLTMDKPQSITITPVIVQGSERMTPFALSYLPSNDRMIPIEYVLDKEPMYQTTDWINEGAFRSQFSFYGNDGRAGDEWNSGKFVKYNQNAASSLVLFNDVYGPGSYQTQNNAVAMAAKYVSAKAFQIMGSDYWNFRIYFNTQIACTPRRGVMYPHVWLIRGG